MNYAEWLKWRDKYFKMQKMTFEEWLIKNEEELNIKFAETGMDRELDFDVEDETEKEYQKYLGKKGRL
mgnify:CR=1 FL=1